MSKQTENNDIREACRNGSAWLVWKGRQPQLVIGKLDGETTGDFVTEPTFAQAVRVRNGEFEKGAATGK